ncbi:MAG: DNRLRE domain-containing protein, partial [Candidatus Thermoplasmatota archaeon]|nr:DNRLRE domain-containing protein [Candidatus Thermoplasmatota archaeon]
MYYWRVKHVDNDGREGLWNETSFFVTSVSSQWLGGDVYKLTINNSVDQGFANIPNFPFSTISSNSPNANSYGYPFLSATQSSTGESNALLGFDAVDYLLPNGMAVIESQLTLSTFQVNGLPEVGIWELTEPNWDQQEVTWLESSVGVPWSGPGATGSSDRSGLLDSQVVSPAAKTTWNITSAMQNSMRSNKSLNLLLDVLPGQPNTNAIFFSPMTTETDNLPTIEIIYSPGSNAKPIPPSALKPANGEWLFANNSTMEVDNQPLIEWTPNNAISVLGWSIEIDSNSEFNSPNKISASSWNDPGFDIINNQYTLQSPLQIGQQWFWRVRALSSTYQLGDWSSDFHFYLPDLNVNLVDDNSFTTEFYQNSPLANSDYFQFIDTGLTEGNLLQTSSLSDLFIGVGTDPVGFNSSMLVKIPIPVEIHPDNASVVDASFSVVTTAQSTTGIPIAVREVLKPWNESISDTMFDGVNNWSTIGGRGIGTDISAPLDIQNSTIGEMSWDITPLVQSAFDLGQNYVSLMLYAQQTQLGDLVYFQSSDYSSGQPKINLTWEYGYRELPSSTVNLVSPVAGQIYFNQTSHAIIPDTRPTFEWEWPITATPIPDAWIVSFDLDPSNDMAGKLEFDSRLDPQCFDLNSLTFV